MFFYLLLSILYFCRGQEASGLTPPMSFLYRPLWGRLALEQDHVAHPYLPPCPVTVWDCTIDQLHALIVYKHNKKT